MEVEIEGKPSFSHLKVIMEPGDAIVTESGSMASMDGDLDMTTKIKGGLFKGLLRKIFGGESLFINTFKNASNRPQRLVLSQCTPGDVKTMHLTGGTYFMQPGAFLACEEGVRIETVWAGFRSLIAREGLFRIAVTGKGRCWFSCYGAMESVELDGELLVDTGHLVAYPPTAKLKLQLAGGIFSSLFGGEGFVARLEGKGTVIIQTRSLGGLVGWLNPRIR